MIIHPAHRLDSVKEYYFSRKLREIRAMIGEGIDVINMGIGNPDRPPSMATVHALSRASEYPQNHGYQPYKGIPELREAMAWWYGRTYEVKLDPNREILPLMGSKEGIMHVSMAFLNPGDEVLVPNPGYPTYSSVSKLLGAKIRYYDLKAENNWFPDLGKLEQEGLDRVKLFWLNYPHMPSGALPTYRLFQELVRFARQHNILLCHDNPYSLILNNDPLSILNVEGAWDVAVELNSLSKSHNMPGWRVGMVAGSSDYIETILKVKSNFDSGMFYGLQESAISALHNSEDWHEENNQVYRERRLVVEQILTCMDCKIEPNQAGMFVWARIPESVTSVEEFVDTILEKARVFITPGIIFGSNGARYVRASLCVPEIRLQEALTRVQMAFGKHRIKEIFI